MTAPDTTPPVDRAALAPEIGDELLRLLATEGDPRFADIAGRAYIRIRTLEAALGVGVTLAKPQAPAGLDGERGKQSPKKKGRARQNSIPRCGFHGCTHHAGHVGPHTGSGYGRTDRDSLLTGDIVVVRRALDPAARDGGAR